MLIVTDIVGEGDYRNHERTEEIINTLLQEVR
jgi:hypothetical protein